MVVPEALETLLLTSAEMAMPLPSPMAPWKASGTSTLGSTPSSSVKEEPCTLSTLLGTVMPLKA